MGRRGPYQLNKPHRECRALIEEERHKLIDYIQAEKKRVTQQRNDIRDMIQTFNERADRFRAVFDAAWNCVVFSCPNQPPSEKAISILRIALEKADHQWEGFAGCTFDPDPRAEQRKSENPLARGSAFLPRANSRGARQ